MGVALTAPVAVPRVAVGVEVDQSHRAVLFRDGANLTQCDPVVAAEAQRHDTGLEDRLEPVDDYLVGGLDVARDDREVTGIDHR